MSRYEVDMAELQRVDVLLGECAGQTRAALRSLSTSAHELFTGRWTSPAAATFRLGWEEWVGGVHDALAALDELGRAVGVAGRGYGSTDDGVRTAVARSSA